MLCGPATARADVMNHQPEFTRVGCEFHEAASYQLSAHASNSIYPTAEK
jgi:hypothetical protein